MKKMLLVGMAVAMTLPGCKKVPGPANDPVKIEVPTSALDPSLQTAEEPASPDIPSMIKTPQPSSKGLVAVNELKFLVGYEREPIVLDSYGDWRDSHGEKVSKKLVKQIFREVPEYGYTVMRWNEDLDELTTNERTKVLTRFQKLVAPAKEPVDSRLIKFLDLVWERLIKTGDLLELLSPKAKGAYGLTNEILELNPKPVPLYQGIDSSWTDQDRQEMSAKDANEWFEANPECEGYLKDIERLLFERMSSAPVAGIVPNIDAIRFRFREAYVEHYQNLVQSGAGKPYDEDDYSWWNERLDSTRLALEALETTPITLSADDVKCFW